MRSEAEADREADRVESGFIKCQPQVPVDPIGLKEIEALEAAVGPPSEEPQKLEWVYLKKDNYLLQNLKKMAGMMAYMLEKEIKAAEKDIAQARKVFYG